MRTPQAHHVVRLWRAGFDTTKIAERLRAHEFAVAKLVACYIDRKHTLRERAARLAERHQAARDKLGITAQSFHGVSLPHPSIQRAG